MVAGGGASVIYADTIVALGSVSELANYGEYSGGPNETQTFEYAKTIIDLMCKHPHPDGKIFIIGGGIANFTNVADTFKGMIFLIWQDFHNLYLQDFESTIFTSNILFTNMTVKELTFCLHEQLAQGFQLWIFETIIIYLTFIFFINFWLRQMNIYKYVS